MTFGAGNPAAIAISSTTSANCSSLRSDGLGSRAFNASSAPPTPARWKSALIASHSPAERIVPGSSNTAPPITTGSGLGILPGCVSHVKASRPSCASAPVSRQKTGGSGIQRLTTSAMSMTAAYSKGVIVSATGMPMTMVASADTTERRHVARRLRRCASKKLSRSRGPANRVLVALAAMAVSFFNAGASAPVRLRNSR